MTEQEILKKVINTNTVMICRFGSHLYGTNTPDSDMDYKGIQLTDIDNILLGRIPQHHEYYSSGDTESKNTNEDIDIEIFSLHEFIKLALQGQTCALDILHVNEENLLFTSDIWKDIVVNREKFYSKNIESFVGYAQGQASKYGVKGSRLNDAKNVLDWFENVMKQHADDGFSGENTKMCDVDLSTFPTGEHISFIPENTETKTVAMYEVCQRKLTITAKLRYNKEIVKKFYDNYGARAILAAKNEGIDWKAISHAFRAAFQIMELFSKKTITFPREEREFLIQVKTGQLNYNDVAPILERMIDDIKGLKECSSLPETSDKEFWDKWLVTTLKNQITS